MNAMISTVITAVASARQALRSLPNLQNVSRSELRGIGLNPISADEAEDAIASIRFYREKLDAEYARLERALENK